MEKQLFYVSRKSVSWPADGPDIAAITSVSQTRNASLAVTGALISTDHYFAQILEGPAAAVDSLMTSIQRDSRHHSLIVLAELETETRWFARWSLAFAGRSSPTAVRIEPFLADPPRTRADVDWLMSMIQASVRPG